MSVLEQVQEDVKTALRAGDRARASALRLVVSELQKAVKDAQGGDVDEVAVLQRERKRRLEAAEAYRDADRSDLADSEQSEADAIEAYLPEQLSDDELEQIVDEAISQTDASSPKEMGQVMGAAMGRVAGRADGKRVSALVKEKLTG